MPIKNPVSKTAHCIFFSPKPLMSVTAIFSAAPLSSKIFPSTAPRQIINASPPRVLPTPASIDFNSAAGCIPRHSPDKMATISNEINGLTFLTVRNTCKAIASMIMSIVKQCVYEPVITLPYSLMYQYFQLIY